jgi:hypothetical protein
MEVEIEEAEKTAPNPSSSLAALPAPLIERGRYDGERVPRGSLFQVTNSSCGDADDTSHACPARLRALTPALAAGWWWDRILVTSRRRGTRPWR